MKEYICKLNWEVVITAKNKKEAEEEAWEIFEDTLNLIMEIEEN